MGVTVGTAWSGSNPNPAYSGIFIPEIWSGKLVEKFYEATVLAAIANTDYEGEIKNQGDKVFIRTRPSITISDYQVNQDLSIQRPSSNLVELNIDKAKYFNLALDDIMEVQADIDLMSVWSEDASEQMKIVVDAQVLAHLASANPIGDSVGISADNYGNTAGRLSNNIRLGEYGTPTYVASASSGAGTGADASNYMSITDYIVNCGQVLDEQNIPETGRWMVVPAWVTSKIKKSELRDASLSGDGTSILRNGRLGMIDRFTLYLSNQLLVDGTYADDWPILFGVKAGFTFASQFTKLEKIRSERSFSDLLRGLQVYGFKTVNGVALGRGVVAP